MKMKSPKHTTIALELHNSDEALLNFTEMLNRQLDFDKITALHVLPSNSPVFAAETQQLGESTNFTSIYENIMEDEIENYLSGRCGQTQNFHVRYGNIEETVLKTVMEDLPDLLIIGQDNKKALHNLTGERIVRKVKADVLVIPSGAKPQISKILVPIDFSEDAMNALARIVAINELLYQPAEITVLNVPRAIHKANNEPIINNDNFLDTRDESRRKFLETTVRKKFGDVADKINIEVVEQGTMTIAEEILRYAQNNHFDLIALGARGHTATSRLLFGSVTEDVVKKSTYIPIWAVKSF